MVLGDLGGQVGCSLPPPASQPGGPPGPQRLLAGSAGAGGAGAGLPRTQGFGAGWRSGAAPAPAALPAAGGEALPAQGGAVAEGVRGSVRARSTRRSRSGRCALDR